MSRLRHFTVFLQVVIFMGGLSRTRANPAQPLLVSAPAPASPPAASLSSFLQTFQKDWLHTEMETRLVWCPCSVSNADSNLWVFFFPLISVIKWTKQKRRRSRRPLPSRPNLDVLGRISQINQIFSSSRQEEPGAGGGGGRCNQLSTVWRR